MTKTKKKEKMVDFKSKPEKITDEQLQKVQSMINRLNGAQGEIGILETRKHQMLHQIAGLNVQLAALQTEFQGEYGTNDINIQDGTINYPKENGEANS